MPQSREDGGGKDPRRPSLTSSRVIAFRGPQVSSHSPWWLLCVMQMPLAFGPAGGASPRLSRPWCVAPSRMPSPKPGPSTPGSLADGEGQTPCVWSRLGTWLSEVASNS